MWKALLLAGIFLVSFSFVQAQTSVTALSLNGTNQYADLGSDPALAATNIKTMECWVKFNNLAGNQEILSRSIGNQGIELLLYNNTLAFFCMNSSTTGSNIGYPTSNLRTGVWYHIAAAWNGTKESMQLYVNDKPVGTRMDNGDINTVGVANPTGTFKIGQWSAVGNDRFLNGTVDEVRIWDIARTATEIKNGIYGTVPTNTTGLVAYYKMNEGSGTTIANSSTSTDAAASSNGTLMNGVTWTTSPVQMSNNALSFDGVDDYVSIGAPLPSGASYTKEAWIYVTNPSIPNNVISSQNSPIWTSSGALAAGNNSNIPEVVDPSPLPANTWVHVTVTFDAATKALRLYRNGNLVQSATSTKSYTGGNNYIGAWFNGTSTESYLGGQIDEARIWNVALTQAQIQANMNTALTGNETNLVTYYSFNQGLPGGNNAGLVTAIDGTANNNHGTLTNFALNGSTSNWIASTSGITLLPVRFTSFTAQAQNSIVELSWTTASEQNSKRFEVERSANGIIYSSIGTVAAAGNSHVTNSYQFTDATPLQGNSFYRLKQVDIDGRFLYSTIQRVVIGGENFSYTLLQNPVRNQLKLNIQLPEAQKLKLEVSNASGVLLMRKEQQFSSGNTTYTLPVANLANGTYFINIITEKGNIVKTFVKQ